MWSWRLTRGQSTSGRRAPRLHGTWRPSRYGAAAARPGSHACALAWGRCWAWTVGPAYHAHSAFCETWTLRRVPPLMGPLLLVHTAWAGAAASGQAARTRGAAALLMRSLHCNVQEGIGLCAITPHRSVAQCCSTPCLSGLWGRLPVVDASKALLYHSPV